MLFKLGKICTTEGVNELMNEDCGFEVFVNKCLTRHSRGDWGDLCEEDKQLNELALRNSNDRLFSRYNYNSETTIYIITEWDRTVTTVLFPEEY